MAITTESTIDTDLLDEAMNYDEYRDLIDSLLEEGKSTGGRDSDSIVHYTKMNVHRMSRLDKRAELKESLKEKLQSLDRQWIWLVLTEGWCGDAAQNVPAIHKMAEATDNIELKLILRDEHPEVMDQYLTNGTRSIPKLVVLDAETLQEIGTWGPRPETAQQLVQEWKAELDKKTWTEKLHKWYADDETEEIQNEFERLIEQWKEQAESI